MKQFYWLEEYQTCSCSFVARIKADLPGYCEKHGTNRKYAPVQIPNTGDDITMGWAG